MLLSCWGTLTIRFCKKKIWQGTLHCWWEAHTPHMALLINDHRPNTCIHMLTILSTLMCWGTVVKNHCFTRAIFGCILYSTTYVNFKLFFKMPLKTFVLFLDGQQLFCLMHDKKTWLIRQTCSSASLSGCRCWKEIGGPSSHSIYYSSVALGKNHALLHAVQFPNPDAQSVSRRTLCSAAIVERLVEHSLAHGGLVLTEIMLNGILPKDANQNY